jgi:hypothetical protein
MLSKKPNAGGTTIPDFKLYCSREEGQKRKTKQTGCVLMIRQREGMAKQRDKM